MQNPVLSARQGAVVRTQPPRVDELMSPFRPPCRVLRVGLPRCTRGRVAMIHAAQRCRVAHTALASAGMGG